MPIETSQLYGARQIAGALGISKRTIRQALAGCDPTGVKIIEGNETRVWAFLALPLSLRQKLEQCAAANQFRNAEALLAQPVEEWKPKLPLRECADQAIAEAVKLRCALSVPLARRNSVTSAELEGIGLAAYQREFGHSVTARHWRRLFYRTLERAAGAGAAEDFGAVELYLTENPARKREVSAVNPTEGRMFKLEDALTGFLDPTNLPDIGERAVWLAALEIYECQVDLGGSSKTVKTEVLEWLWNHVPCLAPTRDALRVTFNRRHARWKAADYNAAALKDRRDQANNDREVKLPEADRDTLISHSVFSCGDRISQGWRECVKKGMLSEATISRFKTNPVNKSHVPTSIREAVKYEIETLSGIHHSPRQVRDNGAYLERDWSGVKSLDWWCADDCTIPVYFYVPDGKGWFSVIRGQFLLMIDARSTAALGFCLIPEAQYNSRAIRSLITKTADIYGLPKKGFLFEKGIWKSSKILTGDNQADDGDWPTTEQGLKEFGLRFHHCIRARSKPVERVLGAIQSKMEGEPGYCGRDERHDGFEALQRFQREVASRKRHPGDKLYTYDQWIDRLVQILAEYNSEPQQGKHTQGLSPEDAMERFKDPNNPGIRFDGAIRHLLAHHKRPVEVTANGVTLRFGKEAFNYRDAQTGALRGQTALAWFNPECPDILTLTDMEKKNPICVARSHSVPAMDAGDEAMEVEMGRIGDHMGVATTRYKILRPKYEQQFRRNVIDSETRELVTGIERGQERIKTAIKEEKRVQRIYRKTGITLPPGQIRPGQAEAAAKVARLLAEIESDEKGNKL